VTADPLFDLEGRVAVVTGGMGQLGAEYAAGLADRGMRVAIFDLAREPGESAADLSRGLADGTIRPFEVDITDRASVEAATRTLVDDWGVPHLLVNNAALDSPPDAPAEEVGPFETYPEASFDQVMNVNVKGTLLCCQVIGGAMAGVGRGSIVNVSSVYGMLSPVQDLYEFRRAAGETFVKPVAYSVSKSAILNLTRYLATYWAKSGVRVNTLTLAGVWNDQPEEFLKAYEARVPLGRMLTAHEALGAVVFLASDASSYVTGANVVVDGGWSAW
jgi:NAD(P)-dependent dehydrogenase (short-subunit alcohol dehydrogenase family)